MINTRKGTKSALYKMYTFYSFPLILSLHRVRYPHSLDCSPLFRDNSIPFYAQTIEIHASPAQLRSHENYANVISRGSSTQRLVKGKVKLSL